MKYTADSFFLFAAKFIITFAEGRHFDSPTKKEHLPIRKMNIHYGTSTQTSYNSSFLELVADCLYTVPPTVQARELLRQIEVTMIVFGRRIVCKLTQEIGIITILLQICNIIKK